MVAVKEEDKRSQDATGLLAPSRGWMVPVNEKGSWGRWGLGSPAHFTCMHVDLGAGSGSHRRPPVRPTLASLENSLEKCMHTRPRRSRALTPAQQETERSPLGCFHTRRVHSNEGGQTMDTLSHVAGPHRPGIKEGSHFCEVQKQARWYSVNQGCTPGRDSLERQGHGDPQDQGRDHYWGQDQEGGGEGGKCNSQGAVFALPLSGANVCSSHTDIKPTSALRPISGGTLHSAVNKGLKVEESSMYTTIYTQ